MTTTLGITNHVRCRWVQSVMEERRDILGVQTLRNQMMAATFLASTAILISLGLLGAAIRPGVFEDVSQVLNLTGARNETLWMISIFSSRFGSICPDAATLASIGAMQP